MKTTLEQIYNHKPCKPGWDRILAVTGKDSPDNTEVSFHDILENGSIEDAVWGLTCFGYTTYAGFTSSIILPMLSRFRYAQYIGRLRGAIEAIDDYCNHNILENVLREKSNSMKGISKELIGIKKWISDPVMLCDHEASSALVYAVRFACKTDSPADVALKFCARSAGAFIARDYASDKEEYLKIYSEAVRRFWLIVKELARKNYPRP